jgi:hypothetical protein
MKPGELTALRSRAQLLSGPPARTPIGVVDRLLAVQAQDPRGFRLAVRSRSTGVVSADVDQALTVERSLLVTTLNRGTLHLIGSEDYGWLHPLVTPPVHRDNARRLAETGIDADRAERGVRVVVAALEADGPLDRHQLRARLDSAGVPTAGQALVHLLLLTSLRGLTVRGPIVDGQAAWVRVADWLGPTPPFDRDRALGELALRYLAGHAPATDRDLARWSGLPLRDAQAGLAAIGDRLHDLGDGLNSLRGGRSRPSGDRTTRDRSTPARSTQPRPRLLGPFDPLLLGWEDRRPIVGEATTLVTTNGIFRPFALVDGRAVATWGLAGGTLTVRPFHSLDADTTRALTTEATRIGRFLALDPRPRVEFADPP